MQHQTIRIHGKPKGSGDLDIQYIVEGIYTRNVTKMKLRTRRKQMKLLLIVCLAVVLFHTVWKHWSVAVATIGMEGI